MPDPSRLNEDLEYHAPVHQLRPETFVHDRTRNEQIMRIQGVVVLPIGAEIELVNPHVSATVVGVRLLLGASTFRLRSASTSMCQRPTGRSARARANNPSRNQRRRFGPGAASRSTVALRDW